jgi:MraZ protein
VVSFFLHKAKFAIYIKKWQNYLIFVPISAILWEIVVDSGSKWSAGTYRRSAYIDEVELMFLGRFEHTIDEKGRMTIPARYREQLEVGAYITLGFDQNLIVLTTSLFEQISLRVKQMSMTDPSARLLRRLIFSSAALVDFDKSGRILIPQFLRDAVSIGTNAVLVGVGDYFEVWSAENWDKQNSQLNDADTNAQRFSTLNL